MSKLDPETGKLSTKDTVVFTASRRPLEPSAIELHSLCATVVITICSYRSTIAAAARTVLIELLGRSRRITGPYFDRDHKGMMRGRHSAAGGSERVARSRWPIGVTGRQDQFVGIS